MHKFHTHTHTHHCLICNLHLTPADSESELVAFVANLYHTPSVPVFFRLRIILLFNYVEDVAEDTSQKTSQQVNSDY